MTHFRKEFPCKRCVDTLTGSCIQNRYIDLAEAKGEAPVNENILKRNPLRGELATG